MNETNRAKISGPTPPEVTEAIQVIAEYLRRGGWVEAIIADTGGVSLRLTSIYDDYARVLGIEPDKSTGE